MKKGKYRIEELPHMQSDSIKDLVDMFLRFLEKDAEGTEPGDPLVADHFASGGFGIERSDGMPLSMDEKMEVIRVVRGAAEKLVKRVRNEFGAC